MNVAKIVKLKDDETVLRVVRNYWIVSAAWALASSSRGRGLLLLPLFSNGWPGVGALPTLNAAVCFIGLRATVVWQWTFSS